jgi:hypothetical protein
MKPIKLTNKNKAVLQNYFNVQKCIKHVKRPTPFDTNEECLSVELLQRIDEVNDVKDKMHNFECLNENFVHADYDKQIIKLQSKFEKLLSELNQFLSEYFVEYDVEVHTYCIVTFNWSEDGFDYTSSVRGIQ